MVTSFFQHDSRDGDPQLHIHNPVLNLAQCSDGQWRTLDSRGIHRHRGVAGAIAERVTEECLTRVLRVRFKSRPDGKAREIVGMPAWVIDLTSSRRRTIAPKAAELALAFEERFGRPPNALEVSRLAREVTKTTRKAKKAGRAETLEQRGERLDRVYRQTHGDVASGLGDLAGRLLWTTDEPAAAEPYSETAVIETALAEVQAGKSTWTRPDLTRAISIALPDWLGGLDAGQVAALLTGLTERALTHPDVVQVGGERDEDLPVVRERQLADGSSAYGGAADRTYALRGQLAAEHALRRAAVERGGPAVDHQAAGEAVGLLAGQGLTLGPDQVQALTGILTSGAKVETLVGPAGTGKSTVVGALARVWTEPGTWPAGTSTPRVFGLAASQVATEVLAAEGVPARNVTRWLDTQARLADPANSHQDDGDWRLSAGDLLDIDEAGMLPTDDLTAIHAHAEAAGAKLLLTGDHRQLSPVGAGGGMRLLAKAGGHELAEVRRFTADWEGPASLRLRDGDQAVLHDYRRRGRLVDAGTPEQARTSATRAWLADTLTGKRSVLVTGTNEDAARLSAEVRAELIRLGRVVEAGVPLGMDGNTAGAGDLVQARRNQWDLSGYEGNTRAPLNRETYRVVSTVDDGGMVAELVDGPHAGTRLTLPPAYVAEHVALGYAVTVNSTQGRTVDTSHVVAGPGTSPEALYVGMSRGRDGNHAHIIARPAGNDQPAGAVHYTTRADPLGVLAGIIARPDERPTETDTSATEQAEHAETRRRSAQTAIERFAEQAADVYTTRTAACLDRLTADGALTADQRYAFAGDTAVLGSVARLLRSAELAGHNPDQILTDAVASRDLTGARSLPQVVHQRIEQRLAGRLTPTATSCADMIPAVAGAGWREQLTRSAEAADDRRRQLGTETAADAPAWALRILGGVPDEPVARLAWEHRAGTVATWRELAGHTDPTDALGAAPRPGLPEHYATPGAQPGRRSAGRTPPAPNPRCPPANCGSG